MPSAPPLFLPVPTPRHLQARWYGPEVVFAEVTESAETPGLYIVESLHGNALERGRGGTTGHAWRLTPGRYELHITLQWDEYSEAYPPRPVDHKHHKPLCLPLLLLSPTAEGTTAAEQRLAVATVTIPELSSSEGLVEQASRAAAECSGFDSPAWTRADFGRFVYPAVLSSAAAAPSVTTPVWRPHNCKLRVYTASEVNSCTAARPVLLIGDSHTRKWQDAFDKLWGDRLAACKFGFESPPLVSPTTNRVAVHPHPLAAQRFLFAQKDARHTAFLLVYMLTLASCAMNHDVIPVFNATGM